MSGAPGARLLMIDNYDSFTYNLVQAFAAQGATVLVHRNDMLEPEAAEHLDITHLVISPGPGRPEAAGRSLDMLARFVGRVPVLGVCLGHQCIVQHFGGRVVRERRLMHGKTSMAAHDGAGVFRGLPQPLEVGRYHSLGASADHLPSTLEVTARTEQEEIMGVRHRTLAVEGVQFHPESVLTPDGNALLANFLAQRLAP